MSDTLKYDLHLLGWSSFQQLCLSITREILGQTVVSFLDSNDGGRDGAFTGKWKAKGMEEIKGKFVIQCKFSSKKGGTLKLSDLNDELPKIKRLVEKSLCDCYVILTNNGISGQQEEKITANLKEMGVKNVLCFGGTWVCQQIHTNQKLRISVPRLYGLGDLSQILDERAYSQAKALLLSLQEELAKIVITESYRKASKALNDHGFVLLVGEPAAGKTTIASMLAMASLDQWGSFTLKLDTPNKVVEHWNPDTPTQLFWIDDAFGVTQYESSLVYGWNHIIPQIKAMLKQGIKIVMTSRDYIYNRARNDLKESAFPLLQESQVVIDVHDLSIEEKRQILYNHLKLGKQDKNFKKEIKQYLEGAANNKRFIPETARRLSDPLFTSKLHLSEYGINEFIEKQKEFLQEILQGLDAHSKAGLGLIYMRNNSLESPIVLQETENTAVTRMGSSLSGCSNALTALNGSFVQLLNSADSSMWCFKHPTIGDAFASLLIKSPELLGVYLHGVSIEKLLGQITCGDVGLRNAVIIPRTLYSVILDRLGAFTRSKEYKSEHLSIWGAKWALLNFLSSRCSKEFLKSYISKNSKILDHVINPGLYLSVSSELRLAHRLHEFNLLPEAFRKQLADMLIEYAVGGEDLYALDDFDARKLLTNDEYVNLKERTLNELVGKLNDVRSKYISTITTATPKEKMEPYLEVLNILKRAYPENKQVLQEVEKEKEFVDEWLFENQENEDNRTTRVLAENLGEDIIRERSIFDDVDE